MSARKLGRNNNSNSVKRVKASEAVVADPDSSFVSDSSIPPTPTNTPISKGMQRSTSLNSVGGRKRKHADNSNQYHRYLLKVLKLLHPEIGFSVKGAEVMNALIVDTLDKLASEIVRLREAAKKKKKMVTAVDMQAAVRLVFPEVFARHAIIEGTKSLEKYRRSLKS